MNKPKKPFRYYSCPDGKTTISVKTYMKEWNKIIKPIEEITGLKIHSFDPSICLCKFENGMYVSGTVVQFPLWFAKILIEKFKKL